MRVETTVNMIGDVEAYLFSGDKITIPAGIARQMNLSRYAVDDRIVIKLETDIFNAILRLLSTADIPRELERLEEVELVDVANACVDLNIRVLSTAIATEFVRRIKKLDI